MTFSKKFCAKSPFKMGVNYLSHDNQMMKHRQNIMLREKDEENKEELLEDAKAKYIKKAERKEKKIADKLERGSTWGVKRKKRKADKLRKQAEELTADEVVSRRAMMRM